MTNNIIPFPSRTPSPLIIKEQELEEFIRLNITSNPAVIERAKQILREEYFSEHTPTTSNTDE